MTSWVWGFYYHFFPAKHGGHDSVPSATSRGGHLERGGPRRSGGGGRQLLPFRGPVAGVLGGVFPRDFGGKSYVYSDRYSENEFFFWVTAGKWRKLELRFYCQSGFGYRLPKHWGHSVVTGGYFLCEMLMSQTWYQWTHKIDHSWGL